MKFKCNLLSKLKFSSKFRVKHSAFKPTGNDRESSVNVSAFCLGARRNGKAETIAKIGAEPLNGKDDVEG